MSPETFKARLSSWTDVDVAAYELAVALGVMNRSEHPFHSKAKHVFWSAHPLGDELVRALSRFAKAGMLEEREEPDLQYRWNQSSKGSWE